MQQKRCALCGFAFVSPDLTVRQHMFDPFFTHEGASALKGELNLKWVERDLGQRLPDKEFQCRGRRKRMHDGQGIAANVAKEAVELA